MSAQEAHAADSDVLVHKAIHKSEGPVLDTNSASPDASCALVQSDPGAGGEGVHGGVEDEALAALRQYAGELATNAGHPRLEFAPGQVIMAGADPWAKFLRFAEEDQATAAIEPLELL